MLLLGGGFVQAMFPKDGIAKPTSCQGLGLVTTNKALSLADELERWIQLAGRSTSGRRPENVRCTSANRGFTGLLSPTVSLVITFH